MGDKVDRPGAGAPGRGQSHAQAPAPALDPSLGAPPAAPPRRTAPQGARDLRAESIGAAIAAARAKSGPTDKEKLISDALEKNETEELRRALGLDIPLDVRALITKGVVEKRGMKVGPDLFVDMHTLNKAEDIMAERLVEECVGPMQLTKSYLEAKLTATIAIATTRVNKELFPVPSTNPADRGTEDYRRAWELKKGLMQTLLEMDPVDVDDLGRVYSNLDKMDVLIQEEARKKSG
jgi:hypothetical protein